MHSKKRKKTEIVVLDNTKVKVLSPLGKPHEDIHQLVKSSSRWIFQQQLRLREHRSAELTYCDGSTLPYLGMQYPLQIFDAEDG